MKAAAISLILLVALSLGCTGNDAGTPGDESEAILGFAVSPLSYSESDFTSFLEDAGEAVLWAGDWAELNTSAATIAAISTSYGLVPVIEVQFFEQDRGVLIRPLNSSTRQLYMQLAAGFAEAYKPEYLGLGIEVDILYERSSTDFEAFVRLFYETYDEVKAVSPGTKVFTVFQLERLMGLKGGLYGGENDPEQSKWFLIDAFPKADLVAFTTYPSLIYRYPSEIPSDHYSQIASHTDKPVIFTEVGWHVGQIPGWESDESEQAEFISRFFNLTRSLEPELAIWSFMYDQDVQQPFNTMGLRNSDGSPREGWAAWSAG